MRRDDLSEASAAQPAEAAAMDHRDPDTYRFDGYLEGLGNNWYSEDPLLCSWLTSRAPEASALAMVGDFGHRTATRYRALAEVVERPENLPRLGHQDPYNRHSQEVLLPAETWQMLGEVHGSGIWHPDMDERARYGIVYLLSQNGEAGIVCSTACTDGMLRALRALGDDDRSREVIAKLEQASPEAWIHGAQFVTEIQGGSDAATNALRAEEVGDGLYRLYGDKWFCSNLTADYWMVTARLPGAPANHRGIGLFCVPRRWQHQANAHVIHRLKDKLGTRALPTAELTFTGATAWPVGPLDAGLKNMVGIVLTASRVYNTLAGAAGLRSAVREARAYANFRQAFGRRLADHPLLAASLARLQAAADRYSAGAFATVDAWLDAQKAETQPSHKLWSRLLISMAKSVTARDTVGLVYEAMMVLGGNGIEERFCALPRLWRDAAIMETWEGPYTLLLMQTLGDMVKYEVAGREEQLLRLGLGDHLRREDARQLATILAAPERADHIEAWAELAHSIYGCFCERALDELRTAPR